MKFLNINNKLFYKELDFILKKRSHNSSTIIDNEVYQIIQQVKSHGDKALFKYAKKFDKSSINKKNILLSKEVLKSYKNKIDDDILKAFRIAIRNITNFHPFCFICFSSRYNSIFHCLSHYYWVI